MTNFALLSYSTFNLGDEIQSVAARQFLPKVDLLVDRDEWTTIPPQTGAKFKIILNGWFTHKPELWPPPEFLSPVIVSMHIARDPYKPDAVIAPAKALLQGESLEYLKRHEPIGGRDVWTTVLLQQHGIQSYFSGCITLTLGADDQCERGDYICAVDLTDELFEALSKRARGKILRLSHTDQSGGSFEQRSDKACRLLSLYQHAHCVVTTRLHCALPCLAFGTPVLLINSAKDEYRFSGLLDLTHSWSPETFMRGYFDYDFWQPPANSSAYLPLRKALTARLAAFTGSSVRPFTADHPSRLTRSPDKADQS